MKRMILKLLVVGLVVVTVLFPDGVVAKKKKVVYKLTDVAVETGFADTESTPDGYVDIPGAAATVKTGRKGLVLVRFSAESRCYDSQNGYCSVRVLVDGQEANPADDAGAYFDSTGGGGWQNRMIERSMDGLSQGGHDVVVQWGTFGPKSTKFEMGAWHLTVEAVK